METYSIVYHANGGEGEDYVVSKVACGENILATLAETKVTPKENKQFTGWAKSENSKVINEIIINIDGNKDLYAIWKDIEIDPEPTTEPKPSTEPKPTTEPETENLGISTGAIIGIIFGCNAIIFGFFIYFFVVKKRKKNKEMDLDVGLILNN